MKEITQKDKLKDIKNFDDNKYFKFINSGTIDPYCTLWGERKTQYIKNQYQNPLNNRWAQLENLNLV